MDFSSWKKKCCLSCRVKASCFARNSSTWHQTFGSWKLECSSACNTSTPALAPPLAVEDHHLPHTAALT